MKYPEALVTTSFPLQTATVKNKFVVHKLHILRVENIPTFFGLLSLAIVMKYQ
jgi:hypothetical protein